MFLIKVSDAIQWSVAMLLSEFFLSPWKNHMILAVAVHTFSLNIKHVVLIRIPSQFKIGSLDGNVDDDWCVHHLSDIASAFRQ